MLSEKKIREAESNVKHFLEEGLIKKESFQEIVFNVLARNAKDSLDTADFIFENRKSDLWVVVTSYYAMYYIANAMLYRLGYKVGHKIPHKVTADALIVFVRSKLKLSLLEDFEEARDEALGIANVKADEIIEIFDLEREKRSKFQYDTSETAKRSKAQTSLERAKKFVFEMGKITALKR